MSSEEDIDIEAVEDMVERVTFKAGARIEPSISQDDRFPEPQTCRRKCGRGLFYFWRAIYHSKRLLQGVIVIIASTTAQHASAAAGLGLDAASTYGALSGLITLVVLLTLDFINIQCAVVPPSNDPYGPTRFSELHFLSVLHFLVLVAVLIGATVSLVKLKTGCEEQMNQGAEKCNLQLLFP